MDEMEFKIVRTDDEHQDILSCEICDSQVSTCKTKFGRMCRICYATNVGIKGQAQETVTNETLAQVANQLGSETRARQILLSKQIARIPTNQPQGIGDFVEVVKTLLANVVTVEQVENKVKEMTKEFTDVMGQVMTESRQMINLEERTQRQCKAVEIYNILKRAGYYSGT